MEQIKNKFSGSPAKVALLVEPGTRAEDPCISACGVMDYFVASAPQ
jgi:hypothetical protein